MSTPPRIPQGAWRLLVPFLGMVITILAVAYALSLMPLPSWVSWVVAAGLLLSLTIWQSATFIRWGILTERGTLLESVVGRWVLARGDTMVTGWLVPRNPADAKLFAYQIEIDLSEATGQAEVRAVSRLGDLPPEHSD